MAPEQFRDASAATHRSDLYSLGVVAFELLTGRLPFEAESVDALQAMHERESPPLASSLRTDVPVLLDALLSSLLAKDPEARPASATDLARRLRAVANELR
jgi:serine/threonine protein kinase